MVSPSNIWCTPLFQHALSCKNAKSQIHLKLKVKTAFPYVLWNRNYHSNPYIQGTTVPCDYVMYKSYYYDKGTHSLLNIHTLCAVLLVGTVEKISCTQILLVCWDRSLESGWVRLTVFVIKLLIIVHLTSYTYVLCTFIHSFFHSFILSFYSIRSIVHVSVFLYIHIVCTNIVLY